MTVSEWVAQAQRRLAEAGTDSPKIEAEILAACVLRSDRDFVLTRPDHGFPGAAGDAVLARRLQGEPIAYITGQREFFSRNFIIRPGVLVPRQETETLVNVALDRLHSTYRNVTPRVLDLGTGSGCIAITLALEFPKAEVTGSDISMQALDVAKENATQLGAKVQFIRSDGFGSMPDAKFDMIVTNPPYIGRHEALPIDVQRYEPEIALIAGESGLEFYERLAAEAADHLREQGQLMMEVGYRQAREVERIFEAVGWTVVGVTWDLSGVERVVTVRPVFA